MMPSCTQYSLTLKSKERRDVATANVVGAYLDVNMDQFTLLKLTGEAVNIMLQVNKVYTPYITQEKGKPVLYLQLKKALHGCVKSALLWYKSLSKALKDMIFELNPYDPCVANKTIEGTKCTIVWYVDNNKISHVSPYAVSDIFRTIEERFGKMTVTKGKEHNFPGKNFVFNINSTVTISMKQYLKERIVASNLDASKRAASPASKGLLRLTNPLHCSHKLNQRYSTVLWQCYCLPLKDVVCFLIR
jgi:hypothetical protein